MLPAVVLDAMKLLVDVIEVAVPEVSIEEGLVSLPSVTIGVPPASPWILIEPSVFGLMQFVVGAV